MNLGHKACVGVGSGTRTQDPVSWPQCCACGHSCHHGHWPLLLLVRSVPSGRAIGHPKAPGPGSQGPQDTLRVRHRWHRDPGPAGPASFHAGSPREGAAAGPSLLAARGLLGSGAWIKSATRFLGRGGHRGPGSAGTGPAGAGAGRGTCLERLLGDQGPAPSTSHLGSWE